MRRTRCEKLDGMWRTVDLVLRFCYVLLAPALLVFCAAVFPITGTLVGSALATIVAVFGSDRWHGLVDRIPVVGRALRGVGRLGAFYDEHAPKPLIYYIAYPVLLPVLLFMRVPRREFLLYRKLNGIALLAIALVAALDYVRHWRPELPFSLFLSSVIAGLVLQLLVTFAIVMPIVTTIVVLHQRRLKKALGVLLACAAGIAILAWSSVRNSHEIQIGTWTRIASRTRFAVHEYQRCIHQTGMADRETCGRENAGFDALGQALDAGFMALQRDPTDRAGALARAHDALEQFYMPDEAAEFRLYAAEDVYVLFVKHRRDEALWIARDARHPIRQAIKLPPGARKLLGY
jgi:hypothetical protein